jgi:hypothetical protein
MAARLGLTTGALGGIVTAIAGAALVIAGLRVVGVFSVTDPDPL